MNGLSFNWLPVKAGVHQGSVLGLLVFLIYISDLSNDIILKVKLFAVDNPLFSVVYDSKISAYKINNDLKIISS